MMRPVEPKDLVILVADADAELGLGAVFRRPDALGIRGPSFEFRRHIQRDPGCRVGAHDFLRTDLPRFRHALVVFDFHGCGWEGHADRMRVEEEVEKNLRMNGWEDRAAVVVIAPELEAWVWSDSPNVESILGWTRRDLSMRQWLQANGQIVSVEGKPEDPKTAMHLVLRHTGKRYSAALFSQLAEEVSFTRCQDPAFRKLVETLRKWFPSEAVPIRRNR